MVEEKCLEKAEKFRDDGNAFFRSGEFQKALECYNKSICFAESGSSELSVAYANRSAVYMQVKKYRKCLENIVMSREQGNLDGKLKEREEKCKRLMEVHKSDENSDPCDFFKLSHPPNDRIPFIVDCLELREDEKFGRYIVTSRDLQPGDVIAIEEPFYKFIDKESRYSRCCNCLKSNDLSLIPCTQCTSSEFILSCIRLFSQFFLLPSNVLLKRMQITVRKVHPPRRMQQKTSAIRSDSLHENASYCNFHRRQSRAVQATFEQFINPNGF
jgi:hypothetical protein